MKEIKKIAVIGSGVMGAGIAAQVANSRHQVLLFDIADKNSSNRSQIASNAIEKLAINDSILMHPDYIKYITACNLDDHLEELKDVDWVVEAIIEKLEVKHDLYNKITPYLSKDAIISSNTSTIPLKSLIEKLDNDLSKRFVITHFFNPVRHMRLMELVTRKETERNIIEKITKFCDEDLGKTVIECNDTPGFIANRIGCFFLELGLTEAINHNISPNVADHILSNSFGIPKTGVFGLMDLIGIDLMELISESLIKNLEHEDYFHKAYKKHTLIESMIANKQLGRKTGSGFYKLNKIGDKKIMQVLDLESREYRDEKKDELPEICHAKSHYEVLHNKHEAAEYAKNVIMQLLYYSASLIPSVSANISDIDLAMKLGFNWKYGPFEMIDLIEQEFLLRYIKANHLETPEILTSLDSRKFYDNQDSKEYYLGLDGKYHEIAKNYITIADIEQNPKNLIYKNEAAQILDMGDGVVVFELKSKMNSLNIKVFEALSDAIEIVEKNYKSMVIGSDNNNFCVGGDLKFFLSLMNSKEYDKVADFIKLGQETMLKIKYAKFPVIAALCGYALGGGTELLLHCHKIQAHVESYIGLVEPSIGVLPGWGGTKQLILNYYNHKDQNIEKAFNILMQSKISKSAQLACDDLLLHEKMHFSMNRNRLLSDAKNLALLSLENFKLEDKKTYQKIVFSPDFSKFDQNQQYVAKHIYKIFMADEINEDNLIIAERDNFVALSKTEYAIEKISNKI